MTAPAYAAVDLGAESARVMVGTVADGTVELEEVARMAHRPVQLPDGSHWDMLGMFARVLHGLHTPLHPLRGVAVDAWGVDYGLLDRRGSLLGLPFHYRDSRTDGMVERAAALVPAVEAYAITGIQTMPINTIYQLLAEDGAALGAASKIALIPDLVAYWLCGDLANESTAASTTALFDARAGDWARGLIARLGLPDAIFGPVVEPGTRLGTLLPRHQLGALPVYATAGHDTGAAFVAAPIAGDDSAILSSGTWSLLGLEVREPLLDERSCALNLTNERGVDGTIRLLRNVMGLWLVQCSRLFYESRGTRLSYDEVVALANGHTGEVPLFDPDDPSLMAAHELDVPAAIGRLCGREPSSPAELFRSILVSLACKYRYVLELLEAATGRSISTIHVIGGGVRNTLLCRLTAELTGRLVLAGPVEATALGNVLVQARADGELASLADMRALVAASVELARYEPPADPGPADATYARFRSLLEGDRR